ncbi:MAG: hypothetical protein MI919_02620, partial [Holophagales bacterium]|nr:hypothetical protein [Holophagales bacterium]
MPFLVLLVFLAIQPLPLFAQALGTVDLLFSTDGGTLFTESATVDDMSTFLMRIYFDNVGDAPGTDAAVTAMLPAGFSRVPGTTQVCLEPTPGELVCNTDVGQGGPILESSVWAAQDLTISPTAGLYGQGVGLTSGHLAIGKNRYLNLHDCHYFNGAERFFVTADPDISGTNISGTIDAAAACAGTVGAYGLAGAELRTVDLLGQRYLNYHECHYNFFTDHIFRVTDGTATRTSNVEDGAFNCAGTAGAHILHPDSSVTNFDLFGFRYLNLWECRYISGGDLISLNTTFATGSNTSNTADVAPSCPAVQGAYTLNDSDHLALDTLDTTRGQGFVQVEVTAESGAGMFDFNAELGANEFAPETDLGTVTVIGIGPVGPIPSVDLKFSHSCGNSFADMAMPYPGETFLTRIYFDNTGDTAGTGSTITTSVPAGYTLVPGSTRVCLEPTPGETICNTDADQGGAIDE